jgi:hypothetical protein
MSKSLSPGVSIDAHGGGLGVIYILTDAARKLSKVGRTTVGTAAGRAASYGKVHGHRWTVFAQMATLRVAEVEANIHAQFGTARVQTSTNAREIFKIAPTEAEAAARALILPPGATVEARRESIKAHVRRVRARLKNQEQFLLARSLKSSIPSLSTAIETEIYPQYVALDALKRGISVEEILDIYKRMISKNAAEGRRIEAEYQAKSEAAWNATSWWSRLWSGTPYVAREEIDPDRFPSVPYYAAEVIANEERATRRRMMKIKGR